MKIVGKSVAAMIMVTLVGIAHSADMKGMDMNSTPAATQAAAATYKTNGTVKRTDLAKGTVTLAHGPVKELKWPAMTMTFTVKDKALLDKFAVDKKVTFEFIQQGKDYVVTTVK